jgi:uncharacterized membrane protein
VDGGGASQADGRAWLDVLLHWIAVAIELAGVAVIVGGILAATVVFATRMLRGDGRDRPAIYHGYRTALARAILLGLEFLVAADIIGTVAVDPTLESLYVLGLIVLIRTFLSFSLEIEIQGHLPWRKPHPEPQDAGTAGTRRG